MITIVARCSVREDTVDDLVALARELVAASRQEEGNVSYDFYADLADPARFTFIENWRDRAAIDAHNATPHFQDFGKRAGPLCAGPIEIALYRRLT